MFGLTSLATTALPKSLGLSADPLATNAANATSKTQAESEAKEVGREFESLFLSLLLKQLRSSLDEGLFQGDGSDVYGSMFDLMLGQSMAESSPLGITQMIERYMTGNVNGLAAETIRGSLDAAL